MNVYHKRPEADPEIVRIRKERQCLLCLVAFAEAARSAGVSSAAPYRHFRDRESLLADVARRGFERFAADLEQAWNDGLPNPLTAFENVGKAYLAFARREPAYYSAMFEAGLPQEGDPAMAAA